MAPRATERPSSPLPSPSANGSAASIVADYMQERRVELESEAKAEASQRTRDRVRRPIAATLAAMACVAAWFAPLPRAGSARVQAPPAAYTFASGRLALNLAARRVDAFIAKHGRVPTNLLDANVGDPGMVLKPTGNNGYLLQLQVGVTLLTYDADLAPAIQAEDLSTILRTTSR